MGTIIALGDETRQLYTKYDFKYFLELNIEQHQYKDQDIQALHLAHDRELNRLQGLLNKNRKQAHFYLDGQIRKCHSGGFLPVLFNLDETRESVLINFIETGETWACFETWRKVEKRRIFRRKFWDVTIKVGALLGFISTFMQIFSRAH